MDAKEQANSVNSELLPSVPSLSTSLQTFYNMLTQDNQRALVKVYRYLWGVVNNHNIKHYGIVSSWWVLRIAAESSGLAPSSLAVLSYLYMMTNKGKVYIHADHVYNSGVLPGALAKTVQRVLWDLKHAGYITRHTKDPGQPYSQRAQHNKQPIFICLTRKGVQCIEGLEKDLYKILLNTSLDDITGANKKP
jgi:Fe2+ or Zn2+ uptake regulation protein